MHDDRVCKESCLKAVNSVGTNIKKTQMKYFGIGVKKTSTTTLGDYFEACGVKRFYGGNVALTQQFLRGDLTALDEVVEKYDGFEDAPWFMAYEYLYQKHPNAKFILTVRSSPEKWLKSCFKHCENYGMQFPFKQVFGYQSPKGREKEYLNAYENHNKSVEEFFSDKQNQFLKICFEEVTAHDKIVKFLGRNPEEIKPIWSNSGARGRFDDSRLFKPRSIAVYYTRRLLASLNLPVP
jgi:hypothetical protein